MLAKAPFSNLCSQAVIICRRIILNAIIALSLPVASGQTTALFVGTESQSLIVKSGQAITISGLTLTPRSDLDLTDKQFIKTTTVSNTATQLYVPLVYHFPNTISLFEGSIDINYSTTSISGFNENNFKVQYHNGLRWIRETGSSVNTTNDVIGNTFLSAVNLNEITLSDVAVALPLNWLRFEAIKQNDGVKLTWSTTNEQNTKNFEVKCSSNGLSWTILGMVDAAGNSNSARTYIYQHTELQKGTVFYQIKQVDFDGQSSLSKIVSLTYNANNSTLKAYPNPTKNVLNITLAEKQQIRLINSGGIVVWAKTLPSGRHLLEVGQLPRGNYLLQSKHSFQSIILQ